jgi:hypothetical protein
MIALIGWSPSKPAGGICAVANRRKSCAALRGNRHYKIGAHDLSPWTDPFRGPVDPGWPVAGKELFMMRAFSLALALLLGTAATLRAEKQFIISYWFGPPKAETTLKRYQEIAECGFNVVLPPAYGTDVQTNKKILDLCKKTGMKAFLEDSRLLAKQPNATDFGRNLDAVLADYSAHSALAGYFLTDEPGAGQFPQLAAVNQYLLKKDPKRIPFINLLPNYASPDQLGTRTYEEHVSRFIKVVKPTLVSWDHYALFGAALGNKERPNYFENLEIVRKQATQADLPFVQIILSVPHLAYRDPNEAELRWQVFTTLAYGAKGVLYFTYWTPYGAEEKQQGFREALIGADGKRTAKYDLVKRLNTRVKALGPTLLKLQPVAAYHTDPVPQGAQKLDPKGPVAKAAGGELLIGWLRDDKNVDYMFVVNRSMRKKCLAEITLAKPARQVDEISQEKSGQVKKSRFDSDKGLLQASLEPGDGKLLVVKR